MLLSSNDVKGLNDPHTGFFLRPEQGLDKTQQKGLAILKYHLFSLKMK